jgi:hypothetical protein
LGALRKACDRARWVCGDHVVVRQGARNSRDCGKGPGEDPGSPSASDLALKRIGTGIARSRDACENGERVSSVDYARPRRELATVEAAVQKNVCARRGAGGRWGSGAR